MGMDFLDERLWILPDTKVAAAGDVKRREAYERA
jgi:hypothetical protein